VTWEAGPPVLLRTGGLQHLADVWFRVFAFGPRWLAGSVPDRQVSLAELPLRDPRQMWGDRFQLQLAQALLSANGIDRG